MSAGGCRGVVLHFDPLITRSKNWSLGKSGVRSSIYRENGRPDPEFFLESISYFGGP
jgi:hypothetical protein